MNKASRVGDAGCDRTPGAAADEAARAVLAARLGETVLLLLDGSRYRLTAELFFRLEHIDGVFVHFFRRADALERRMRQLGAASAPRILAPARGVGRRHDN